MNKMNNFTLICIMLITAVIFVVLMMFFERYIVSTANKQLIRIMLFSLLLNVIILVFLIFSYSKITFEPGIQGPKGIKGRVGPRGRDSNIAECSPKNESLGNAKMFIKKENKLKEFIKPHLKS